MEVNAHHTNSTIRFGYLYLVRKSILEYVPIALTIVCTGYANVYTNKQSSTMSKRKRNVSNKFHPKKINECQLFDKMKNFYRLFLTFQNFLLHFQTILGQNYEIVQIIYLTQKNYAILWDFRSIRSRIIK